MRIVEINASNMEFWELKWGDVFKVKLLCEDERILMKCREENSTNAVDLETGILYYLAVDAECMLVDATLTIKPYSEEP